MQLRATLAAALAGARPHLQLHIFALLRQIAAALAQAAQERPR